MTNILLLPLFVSGKGPKKSIWTRSIGAPAWQLMSGHFSFLVAFLNLLHFWHVWTSWNNNKNCCKWILYSLWLPVYHP
jgi:hypothetical protein